MAGGPRPAVVDLVFGPAKARIGQDLWLVLGFKGALPLL